MGAKNVNYYFDNKKCYCINLFFKKIYYYIKLSFVLSNNS